MTLYDVTVPSGDLPDKLAITPSIAAAFRAGIQVPSLTDFYNLSGSVGSGGSPIIQQLSVYGNPSSGSSLGVSLPVAGGLKFEGGSLLVGGAETWRNKTIYAAVRTDNPQNGGTGTINDPYDFSTWQKIEAILGPLSVTKTKINLILAPGLYTIRPMDPANPSIHPWFFRDGWHWQGAGKGRTIIQVPSDNMNGRNMMVSWSRLQGESEFIRNGSIRGITFDGRVTETPTLPDSSGNTTKYTAALDLEGDDLTIEDCEFKNLGGNGQEVFPVILTNGFFGDSDRACSIIMRRCRFRDIWSGINSAGIAIGGKGIGFGLANSVKQRFIITDNHITDCYPALYNSRNVLIQNNWIDAGRAQFCCINCDTGNNEDVHILDNVLIGATYNHAVMGAICIGNPTQGKFDRFVIARNYLWATSTGYLTCGIRMRGRVKDYIIRDNVYKPHGPAYTYMLLRDDAMPPPWGTPPDYPGLGESFSPPTAGNENGDPRLMLGNVYDGTSATPDGVPDTVRGTFTATSNITSGGAFVAQGINAGYNHLYVGHAGLVDPYAAASLGIPDLTRASIEVLNSSSGATAISLIRTGSTSSRWSLELPSSTTYFDISNVLPGPPLTTVPILRMYGNGDVEAVKTGATITGDILLVRQKLTLKRTTGTASEWEAVLPVGQTYLDLRNVPAATTTLRLQANGNVEIDGNTSTGGAFTATGCNMGYGHLYIGHSGLIDVYAVASFGAPDVTRTGVEIWNSASGSVVMGMRRTGVTPSDWELQIPSGNDFLDLCNTPSGAPPVPKIRFLTNGNATLLTANASISADILTPAKGVTFRSGSAWPVSGNIPSGTSVTWKNTTTNTLRVCAYDGANMHYGPIFSTTP